MKRFKRLTYLSIQFLRKAGHAIAERWHEGAEVSRRMDAIREEQFKTYFPMSHIK